jgi:hypothetical protein
VTIVDDIIEATAQCGVGAGKQPTLWMLLYMFEKLTDEERGQLMARLNEIDKKRNHNQGRRKGDGA